MSTEISLEGKELTLIGIGRMLLRRLPLIVVLSAALLAGFVLLRVVRGTDYTARSVFLPQGDAGSAARLSGLAAQFGIGIPSISASESVQFYARLVKSRDLLREAALAPLALVEGDDTVRGSYVELMGIDGDTPEERVKEAIGELQDAVSVSTDLEAGLVTLSTTTSDPGLAVQLNQTLLRLLNDFNLERRQTQAGVERDFIARRLEEASGEMAQAERALQRFLEQNRTYQTSPQLSFEAARLQSELDLRRALYNTLMQSHEQAQIDEVRNTPVITVVENPEGSSAPATGLIRYLVIAALGAFTIALLVALALEILAQAKRERPEEFAGIREDLQRVRVRLRR